MRESQYQKSLVDRLRDMFPGCHIQRNDPRGTQGIPDLLILFRERWAMLEVKPSMNAPFRPNQEHYIEQFDELSFCAMICPENEAEVLHALQQAFGFERETRIS